MPTADDAPTMPASSTATSALPTPVLPPAPAPRPQPVPVPPAADAPDAGLIALCDEFLVLEREVARRMTGLASPQEEERVEAECEPLDRRMNALVEQISASPAITEDGRRGKAAVARQLADQNLDGTLAPRGQCDVVTFSLLADLLGKGGGLAPRHPDAELIRLGWELEAAWIAQDVFYDTHPHPEDAESNAAIMPCSEITAAIKQLPAYTLDGLRVKGRAFAWCAFTHRKEVGQIDPAYFGWDDAATTDERLAASVLQTLVNMGLPPAFTPTEAA